MKIICSECKKDISNTAIVKGFIRCPFCNFLYNYKRAQNEKNGKNKEYKTNKSTVLIPKNLKIYTENEKLIIERSLAYEIWNTLYSIAIGAGLIYLYYIPHNSSKSADPDFLEKLFDLFFQIGGKYILLAFGIYNIYYGITSFFNKIIITIDKQNIIIKHTPFPAIDFFTSNNLSLKNLTQLYCYMRYRSRNIPKYTYEVYAKFNNRKDLLLARKLYTYEEARFIEQEIEKFLGIEDIDLTEETRS